MIENLESAKTALREERQRVFTGEHILWVCRNAGLIVRPPDNEKSLFKALGFELISIKFPYSHPKFYIWPGTTLYEIGQALKPRGYLAHLAALGFHGLVKEPIPHLIVNDEQSPKPQSDAPIRQAGLASAFKKAPRISNNKGALKLKKRETFFYLTNSKNTKELDVVEELCGPTTIRVTTIARSLFDSTARPFYGGGPAVVLGAYRKACEKIEPARLVTEIVRLIPQIGHKYPYHQAVGFYLEMAVPNMPKSVFQPLREMGLQLDFYLDYQMEETSYNKEWRMYYPADLILK